MFISNSKYILDEKCDECENKSICKWINDMRVIESKVASIKQGLSNTVGLSPIRVTIQCNSFKKKSSGFMEGQRG